MFSYSDRNAINGSIRVACLAGMKHAAAATKNNSRVTPASVIAKLDAEFRKALAAADVRERLATQSADIIAGGPREFGDMIRRDTARWAEVVKVAHIKIE